MIIKCLTAVLIAISFSSCQTMPSGNDHVVPPVHKVTPKTATGPMIV